MKREVKRGVHVRQLWMNVLAEDAVNIAQGHGSSALRDNCRLLFNLQVIFNVQLFRTTCRPA